MGNQISTPEIDKDKWNVIGISYSCSNFHSDLVQSTSSGQKADQYTFELPSNIEWEQQSEIYRQRDSGKSGHLVTVISATFHQNEYLCFGENKVSVRTERIPIRISQIQDLSDNEAALILNGAFSGYHQLLTLQKKPFFVNSSMMGINQQEIVKVWFNGNFGKNQPSVQHIKINSQQAMINEIVQSVKMSKTNKNFTPELESILINKNSLNMYQVSLKIHQYLTSTGKYQLAQTEISKRMQLLAKKNLIYLQNEWHNSVNSRVESRIISSTLPQPTTSRKTRIIVHNNQTISNQRSIVNNQINSNTSQRGSAVPQFYKPFQKSPIIREQLVSPNFTNMRNVRSMTKPDNYQKMLYNRPIAQQRVPQFILKNQQIKKSLINRTTPILTAEIRSPHQLLSQHFSPRLLQQNTKINRVISNKQQQFPYLISSPTNITRPTYIQRRPLYNQQFKPNYIPIVKKQPEISEQKKQQQRQDNQHKIGNQDVKSSIKTIQKQLKQDIKAQAKSPRQQTLEKPQIIQKQQPFVENIQNQEQFKTKQDILINNNQHQGRPKSVIEENVVIQQIKQTLNEQKNQENFLIQIANQQDKSDIQINQSNNQNLQIDRQINRKIIVKDQPIKTNNQKTQITQNTKDPSPQTTVMKPNSFKEKQSINNRSNQQQEKYIEQNEIKQTVYQKSIQQKKKKKIPVGRPVPSEYQYPFPYSADMAQDLIRAPNSIENRIQFMNDADEIQYQNNDQESGQQIKDISKEQQQEDVMQNSLNDQAHQQQYIGRPKAFNSRQYYEHNQEENQNYQQQYQDRQENYQHYQRKIIEEQNRLVNQKMGMDQLLQHKIMCNSQGIPQRQEVYRQQSHGPRHTRQPEFIYSDGDGREYKKKNSNNKNHKMSEQKYQEDVNTLKSFEQEQNKNAQQQQQNEQIYQMQMKEQELQKRYQRQFWKRQQQERMYLQQRNYKYMGQPQPQNQDYQDRDSQQQEEYQEADQNNNERQQHWQETTNPDDYLVQCQNNNGQEEMQMQIENYQQNQPQDQQYYEEREEGENEDRIQQAEEDKFQNQEQNQQYMQDQEYYEERQKEQYQQNNQPQIVEQQQQPQYQENQQNQYFQRIQDEQQNYQDQNNDQEYIQELKLQDNNEQVEKQLDYKKAQHYKVVSFAPDTKQQNENNTNEKGQSSQVIGSQSNFASQMDQEQYQRRLEKMRRQRDKLKIVKKQQIKKRIKNEQIFDDYDRELTNIEAEYKQFFIDQSKKSEQNENDDEENEQQYPDTQIPNIKIQQMNPNCPNQSLQEQVNIELSNVSPSAFAGYNESSDRQINQLYQKGYNFTLNKNNKTTKTLTHQIRQKKSNQSENQDVARSALSPNSYKYTDDKVNFSYSSNSSSRNPIQNQLAQNLYGKNMMGFPQPNNHQTRKMMPNNNSEQKLIATETAILFDKIAKNRKNYTQAGSPHLPIVDDRNNFHSEDSLGYYRQGSFPSSNPAISNLYNIGNQRIFTPSPPVIHSSQQLDFDIKPYLREMQTGKIQKITIYENYQNQSNFIENDYSKPSFMHRSHQMKKDYSSPTKLERQYIQGQFKVTIKDIYENGGEGIVNNTLAFSKGQQYQYKPFDLDFQSSTPNYRPVSNHNINYYQNQNYKTNPVMTRNTPINFSYPHNFQHKIKPIVNKDNLPKKLNAFQSHNLERFPFLTPADQKH